MARPLALAALLLLCAGTLAGCVELGEDLAFEADGSGTYDLELRWDQALLKQLVDLVGPRSAARFRGRDLPLTEAAWRDGLTDLEGVEVRTLTLEEGEGGRRILRVQLRFRHLRDLLGWELFARRDVLVRPLGPEDRPAHGELVMGPLARIPYLDPLLAARAARRAEPAQGEETVRELDPGPFERLGIPAHRAELAETLLAPRLREVKLTFRVRPPGAVASVEGPGEIRPRGARFVYDVEALEADEDRTLRLRWRPRPFDPVPRVDHEGDRRTPAGGSR